MNNFSTSDSETFKDYCAKGIANWDYETLRHVCTTLLEHTKESDEIKASAIDVLTHLNDRHIETGTKKRSSALHLVRNTLSDIFVSSPRLNENSLSRYRFIDWSTRTTLRAPREHEGILVLNAREFPPEGDACDSRLICAAMNSAGDSSSAMVIRGSGLPGADWAMNRTASELMSTTAPVTILLQVLTDWRYTSTEMHRISWARL